FDEMLKRTLKNQKGMHALMMIDLDNFKKVNDNLGHVEGDNVLKTVAKTIHTAVQDINESFSVYRVGGDEFTVILPDTNEKQVKRTAKCIISALNDSLADHPELEGLHVTSSIGIAITRE